MKLIHQRTSGLTSAGTIEIPWVDVPPGIISLVGDNGIGKTTFLESGIPGTFYLQLLTRTGWYRLVADRAELDTTIELNGRRVRGIVNIDGPRRKQSAVLEVDGTEITDGSGGVKIYKAEVARLLPPLALFRAAAFASQDKRGSFADVEGVRGKSAAAVRRELLSVALGNERWTDRAGVLRAAGLKIDHAVKRIRDMTIDLDRHRVDLEQARSTKATAMANLDNCQTAMVSAQQADAAERETRNNAQRALDDGEYQHQVWSKDNDRLTAERDTAQRKHVEAADALRESKAKASKVDALRVDYDRHRDAIEAHQRAQEKVQACQAEHGRRDAEVRAARDSYRAAQVEQGDARRRVDAAQSAADSIEGLRDRAQTLASSREALGIAESKRAELWVDDESPHDRMHAITHSVSDLSRALTLGREKLKRAEHDAELLSDVPCGGQVLDGHDCGSCRLLSAAIDARENLSELRADVKAVEENVRQVEEKRDALYGECERFDSLDSECHELRETIAANQHADAELQRAIDSAAGLADAKADLKRATEALEECEAAGMLAAKARDEAVYALSEAEEAERTASHPLATSVEAELRAAEKAAAQVPVLDEAADAANKARAEAEHELAEHNAGKSSLPSLGKLRGDLDAAAEALTLAEAELRRRQAEEKEALQGVTAAETAAKVATEAIDRCEGLLAKIEPLERKRAGLIALELACGPKGVPALEIDAAGPGISENVNDLLRVGFHGRFNVNLVTQKPKADNKGFVETCEVELNDVEKGWIGPVNDASGGESVPIHAAIRLGLGCHLRNQGGHWDTLWLDEADGAVSANRKQDWMNMLRRAYEMSGLEKLILVSHDANVWRQADTVIEFKGGDVNIVDPGEIR